MSLAELIEAFSLDHISPKAAVFDEKKLEWMNGLYMAERSAASLVPEVLPAWKEQGWVRSDCNENDSFLVTVIDLLKVRSKKITELIDSAEYFFKDPVTYEEKAVKKQFKPETAALLKTLIEKLEPTAGFDHASLESLYRELSEKLQVQAGHFIHPTRLAISGVSFGPGLFKLMEALGKETVMRRMKLAVQLIEKHDITVDAQSE